MYAIGFGRFGGPDVLSVVQVDRPTVVPGYVRIRVAAAAANPADAVMRSGLYVREYRVEPPWVPGMDVAGVVDAVPDGSPFEIGTPVMAFVDPAWGRGGQAEFAMARVEAVAVVPDHLSMPEAATLPMNALTAHQAAEQLSLPRGSSILVTGGAGVLAHAFYPFAHENGWNIIASAGAADSAMLEAQGVHRIVERDDPVGAARRLCPNGVDGVLDAAALGRSVYAAVREGGAIAEVRPPRGDPGGFARAGRSDPIDAVGTTRHLLRVGPHSRTPQPMKEVGRLAAEGLLRPWLAAIVEPSEAVQVHRQMERGGVRGRMVYQFDGAGPA